MRLRIDPAARLSRRLAFGDHGGKPCDVLLEESRERLPERRRQNRDLDGERRAEAPEIVFEPLQIQRRIGVDPRGRVEASLANVGHRRLVPGVVSGDEGEPERFLRRKMMMDARFGEPDRRCEIGVAEAGVTEPANQPLRFEHQAIARSKGHLASYPAAGREVNAGRVPH